MYKREVALIAAVLVQGLAAIAYALRGNGYGVVDVLKIASEYYEWLMGRA